MRIALVSDLHGNLLSLEAVLADARQRGVDDVVCLGDVATLGPRPREVLALLRDRGCRVIMGNHDAFMVDPDLIRTYTEVPIVVDAVDWCRDTLATAEIEWMRGFECGFEVDLGGGATARFFHGSPRSHMEDLLATTDAATLDECLAGTRATVLAGGHTHLAMVRQHRGMLLVNPGSVGMPFREYANGCEPVILPFAEYAVVESERGNVSVALHRVAMDKGALRREAAASPNPICRGLERQYS